MALTRVNSTGEDLGTIPSFGCIAGATAFLTLVHATARIPVPQVLPDSAPPGLAPYSTLLPCFALDSGRDDVIDGWLSAAAAGLFVLPVTFNQVQEHAEREECCLPAVQVQVAVGQIREPGQGFGPATACGCAG